MLASRCLLAALFHCGVARLSHCGVTRLFHCGVARLSYCGVGDCLIVFHWTIFLLIIGEKNNDTFWITSDIKIVILCSNCDTMSCLNTVFQYTVNPTRSLSHYVCDIRFRQK